MVIHIEIPPTSGILPECNFRPDGLSTRPTLRATLRIKNKIANEMKKIKSRSKNIRVPVYKNLYNLP